MRAMTGSFRSVVVGPVHMVDTGLEREPMAHRRTSSLPYASVFLCAALVCACKSELDGKQKAQVVAAGSPKAAAADPQPAAAKQGEATGKRLALKPSSTLGFVGAKVTGDHSGTIEALEGFVVLDEGQPIALEVVGDMKSATSDAEKLTSHLLAEDFFYVEKFPQAKFVAHEFEKLANGAEGRTHRVTGSLTLRGVEKTISFEASIKTTDSTAEGSAEFKIQRSEFGIVYPGRANDLIKDEVLLKLDLAFG